MSYFTMQAQAISRWQNLAVILCSLGRYSVHTIATSLTAQGWSIGVRISSLSRNALLAFVDVLVRSVAIVN